MTEFTLRTTVGTTYDETVTHVRELLGEAGFGVLTEIDLAATLKAKLGVDVAPQVILGACRPQLAHRALEAEPRLATLLPCNVVVAHETDTQTRVEVLDPLVMSSFSDDPELLVVAEEARQRLSGMLAALEGTHGGTDEARA